MKVVINGRVYDSNKLPILLVFDENEKEMFNGMNRFVSAPDDSTVEERQKLIDLDIEDKSTLKSLRHINGVLDEETRKRIVDAHEEYRNEDGYIDWKRLYGRGGIFDQNDND